MKAPLLAILLIVIPLTGNTEEISHIDKFQLWNYCKPIGFEIAALSQEAEEIGVTEEKITNTVLSRLRGARIYNQNSSADVLGVHIYVLNLAFTVDIKLQTWLTKDATVKIIGEEPIFDNYQNVSEWLAAFEAHNITEPFFGYATIWESGSIGTHGNNSGFIIQSLAQHTDKFINEYLRVNADACN